jgi:hypothetical protein
MGLSWLLPYQGSFTTYLTVCVYHKRPRQTDSAALASLRASCPGGFRSAQPMRTAYQLTRIGKTPTYCVSDSGRSDSEQVFTQPQNRVHLTRSFWLEPPNSNCLGSDQFMPESAVHHAARTCPFESRQPLVRRYINTRVSVRNWQQIYLLLLLILGALNPIKLTRGVHVSQHRIKDYGVGLIAPPNPLER